MHPSLRSTHFRTLSLLLLIAVGTLVTSTCDPSFPIGNRQGGATTANRKVSSSEAPGSTPIPMATLSSGERIGVPECDEFLDNYEACVIKVPESAQPRYRASIQQMRESWRELAENPATKATLAQVCKRSAEQTRDAMKVYDCTF